MVGPWPDSLQNRARNSPSRSLERAHEKSHPGHLGIANDRRISRIMTAMSLVQSMPQNSEKDDRLSEATYSTNSAIVSTQAASSVTGGERNSGLSLAGPVTSGNFILTPPARKILVWRVAILVGTIGQLA